MRRICSIAVLAGCLVAAPLSAGPMEPADARVKDTMNRMAKDAAAIADILSAKEAPGRKEIGEIRDRLRTMEERAEVMDERAFRLRHPALARRAERFRKDLRAARITADMNPPVLYLAAAVAWTCTSCHTAGAPGPPQSGTELPETARAVLRERMARHGIQMTELLWAVLFQQHREAQALATAIAQEPMLARGLPGFPEDLNSRVPETFFQMQEMLHTRAKDLAGAAAKGKAPEIATKFGALTETCVTCHSIYNPPDPKRADRRKKK